MVLMWHGDVACRPAATDSLDDDQQMIGIPSNVSLPACEATNSMFFVIVCPVGRVGSRKQPPFRDLRLSSQLGKGRSSTQTLDPKFM